MKKIQIHDQKELDRRIIELEALRDKQKSELQTGFREIAHSLNPANIIRNTVQSVLTTPGLGAAAVDTAVSSGAGYLGKKMVIKKSRNIFLHIAGLVVEFVVANFVRNKILRGKTTQLKGGIK